MSGCCDDAGRQSSLAESPLPSCFPTLLRPQVEFLVRWYRLQSLTRANTPGRAKLPFPRKGPPTVVPHLLQTAIPSGAVAKAEAVLFFDPRPRPLKRPRHGAWPSPLGRFVPLGRPRGRPAGVVRGTEDEKASGSVAPKLFR